MADPTNLMPIGCCVLCWSLLQKKKKKKALSKRRTALACDSTWVNSSFFFFFLGRFLNMHLSGVLSACSCTSHSFHESCFYLALLSRLWCCFLTPVTHSIRLHPPPPDTHTHTPFTSVSAPLSFPPSRQSVRWIVVWFLRRWPVVVSHAIYLPVDVLVILTCT